MKRLILDAFLVMLAACLIGFCVLAFLPLAFPQESGDITFQPSVIPELTVFSRVGRNNESFRFEWLGNKFDIELFFNATLLKKNPQTKQFENVTKLWSLNDFEDDFEVSVEYVVNKNETHCQFGWFVNNTEGASDVIHNAWFKIEDTKPFDYDEIEFDNATGTFTLPHNLFLSFHDLEFKGFIIGWQNKTSTSVTGFKGKTSWNLDPITYSGGVIYVGQDSTDLFEDIYDADKSGTLLLRTAKYVDHTQEVQYTFSLSYPVQPADDLALKLNIIITDFVNNGEVTLSGKDKDGVNQGEVITINGNGVYVTTKWYSSINAFGVICWGKYTIEITQSRWGVFHKQGTQQYFSDVQVYVNDTYSVSDLRAQIEFNSSAITTGQACIIGGANTKITFGELVDLANKEVRYGISLSYPLASAGTNRYLIYSDGDVELYGCELVGFTSTAYELWIRGNNFTIWHCTFDRVVLYSAIVDLYDCTWLESRRRIMYNTEGTMDEIKAFGADRSSSFVFDFQLTGSKTVSNVFARGYDYIIYDKSNSDANDHFLINVDSDSWNCLFHGTTSVAEIFRQYEFDLTASLGNLTYATGANVTISNAYLGTSDSWILSSNGSIPQQTYSMGHYNQTGGNTIYDYNPYNLTVTLDGFDTYTDLINITKKEDLRIALTPTSQNGDGANGGTFNSVYYLLGGISLLPFALIFGYLICRRKDQWM